MVIFITALSVSVYFRIGLNCCKFMASPADTRDPACSSDDVLHLTFNQDYTALAVGRNSGYTMYDTTSSRILNTIHDDEGEAEDVFLIERLFSTSIVAIVSMSARTKLNIWDFKNGKVLYRFPFMKEIIAVRFSHQRLVVMFEESLNIRDLNNAFAPVYTIYDTPPNPKGICALSTNRGDCFLAFPGCQATGVVQLFDATFLNAVTSISAHDGHLAALAFDSTGTKLATASVKGTVIRVFSIPEGELIFEFRRGLKRYVAISSLAFSSDSDFLCVSSNTETVHIFKLIKASQNPAAASYDTSWTGYFNRAVSMSVNYLPTQVAALFDKDRAFATAMLPIHDTRNVCAIATIRRIQYVIVACYNGYVYVYKMDSQNGGACESVRQHCLLLGKRLSKKETTTEYDSIQRKYVERKVSPSVKHGSRVLGFNEANAA